MIDLLTLIMIFGTGLLAGGFFFGGLLWTVRRGITAKHPAFWFIGSWLVRMSVVLGIFYLVAGERWEQMVVCASGFFVARMFFIRIKCNAKEQRGSKMGAGNAS